MDVKRYLVFNHDKEIIRLSSQKISGDKLIILGNNPDDIKKFNPETVLCYQNELVIDMCKRMKINCIHVYHEGIYHQPAHNYICNLKIVTFDLKKIESDDKDYQYNFTVLGDATKKISRIMMKFVPGNNVLVNPGEITTTQILDFYEIERESRNPIKGENRKSISSYPNITPIENYFTDKEDAKVNLYLPTYHRLEKTKKSLESIISGSKLSKYDIKIFIGDNSPNYPELRQWLRELDAREEIVSIYFGEKNIGKSGMVNHLYRTSRKCDYLFSIDTDMIVSKNHNFVDEMIFHLTRLENCGLVSSNQKDCNQHWFGKTVEVICRNGMKVGYSSDGVGIAGGCICLRSSDWEEIGMYKENHDIYTGDDGILTHNIGKILGKFVYVSVDCSLTHPSPGEDEKEYTEWKGKSWQRDQLNFLNQDYTGENRKGFYD